MNIEMANRLFNYRKQSGLSQEELADKLSLSRQAVSKWERAEACPDTDNLIRLSKLYGVSIDTLLNVDPDEVITDSGKAPSVENAPDIENADDKEEPENASASEDEGGADNANGAPADGSGAKINFEGGIHIADGKDVVNIDKTGIHVTDGDDEVHVGWKGIKVNKVGDSDVHISFNGVHTSGGDKNENRSESCCGGDCSGNDRATHVDDKDVHVHFNILDRKKKYIKDIPVGLLVTITYFILGFAFGLWHPAWILFICIPIIDSIINVITYRSIRKFNYPVFVTAAFLFVGCVWGCWHPAWVGFLTIPLFYWIF